jgi:hypothetical protein
VSALTSVRGSSVKTATRSVRAAPRIVARWRVGRAVRDAEDADAAIADVAVTRRGGEPEERVSLAISASCCGA